MHARLIDAQVAVQFLANQMSHIEREVYAIEYPEVRYPAIVPVDTSANEWAPSVTYMSYDSTGKANWFSGRAQDVPLSNVVRSRFETPVKMAAAGYEYDLEEISTAALMGINLQTDKADAARKASEEFIDRAALFGDTAVGYTGLTNSTAVSTGSVPVGAVSGTTPWATKNAQEILVDVNGVLTGIWIGSNTVELADTLLLPLAHFTLISTMIMNPTTGETLLSWLRRSNVYSQRTQRPLTIEPVLGLENIGAGGTARMIAYRRDPRVVKMHIPMPFRFLRQPWQVAPMAWHVPGIFRLGGVDIRRPSAFRYADGL